MRILRKQRQPQATIVSLHSFGKLASMSTFHGHGALISDSSRGDDYRHVHRQEAGLAEAWASSFLYDAVGRRQHAPVPTPLHSRPLSVARDERWTSALPMAPVRGDASHLTGVRRDLEAHHGPMDPAWPHWERARSLRNADAEDACYDTPDGRSRPELCLPDHERLSFRRRPETRVPAKDALRDPWGTLHTGGPLRRPARRSYERELDTEAHLRSFARSSASQARSAMDRARALVRRPVEEIRERDDDDEAEEDSSATAWGLEYALSASRSADALFARHHAKHRPKGPVIDGLFPRYYQTGGVEVSEDRMRR